MNLVPSSSTIDDVEKYQRLLTDFASRVQVKKTFSYSIDHFSLSVSQETTREVEDRLRTAEQLALRGETHGQKDQIVNELVKVHQQYLSRINQTRSFLHTMINYYKNTSKIETQMINNERLISSSLPTDIRTTEVLVRQCENEQEKILQTYEQCRQEAQAAENKAKQVEIFPLKNCRTLSH